MEGLTANAQAQLRRRVGTTLGGRWTIERVLGVGGMATVYVARERTGRRMAVKVLHPWFSESDEARRRLLRERQIVQRIAHEAVVKVHFAGIDRDMIPFLVMDLVEGPTLDELRRRRSFEEREIVDVAVQILDVVAAAHDAGVIHRDLKPDNFVREPGGRIRVLDFGVAHARLGDGAITTAEGLGIGTPGFVPPEQILGRQALVGRSTDLWALGATLFWLATLETPHTGDNALQLVAKTVTEHARSLAAVAPWVSPELAAIVDRALENDPQLRFPTADAMREQLLALPPESATFAISGVRRTLRMFSEPPPKAANGR